MVERPESRTHTPSIVEYIEFLMPARGIDPSQICSFYVEKRLSTAQVAMHFGCSKTFVITALKRRGLLRPMAQALTNPNNFRHAIAPYGYRVAAGTLLPHNAELKVCRMIVDLIDRREMSQCQAAQYLMKKGIKGRNGRTNWHNNTVGRIYTRWKGKL
jgi:hypothetical protein